MSERISEFFNRIISVFSTFKFTDFLDIIFVALLIYIVIRIIRETRAMQLLKGIIILAVIYLIVSLLNMEVSTMIFRSIFGNIILIICVIFAPELRNILEQIGKRTTSIHGLIHPGSAVEVNRINNCIEAVVKACKSMSNSKTGALIVFENDTMLGNIIESGIYINATASKALIENIFFPNTPLHDGALVIRNGKIIAAGCILPLTKKSLNTQYGTRHRAAIGLSEQSDAIIVVVSEETGAISVASDGNLRHGISDGELRDILINNFIPNGTNDEKKIRKILRRNKK